jgi:L-alanine-DL-glutamate epimerase-like enolase superfamily enzyme
VNIEAVDFFYLSVPVVTDAGDGSQDALLVRVAAGGLVGWGECEASPLTSIAAYVCPMSHGACKPVRDVVLGKPLNSPDDIAALAATVEMECMDLLQAAHTFSGVEMALWDLLGRKREAPVHELLGYKKAYRRHAGGNAGRLQAGPRKRLPRCQMRLGAIWPWHVAR